MRVASIAQLCARQRKIRDGIRDDTQKIDLYFLFASVVSSRSRENRADIPAVVYVTIS